MDAAKEMKPTSFRISDEAKERFKSISKEEGWNQDEALKKLISVYDMEQAKIMICDRKTEIETFEAHLHALSNIYLMSLQLNQDAEERMKSTYKKTLESNQRMLQSMQEKNEELTRALEVKGIINEKNKKLEKERERILGEMEKTERLCQQYKEKNDTLNGLLVECKQEREENKKLQVKLKEMDNFQSEAEKQKEKLESEKKQTEYECKIEIIKLKEEHQKQLAELSNKNHKELEEVTKNYGDVLKKLEAMQEEYYKLKETALQSQYASEDV